MVRPVLVYFKAIDRPTCPKKGELQERLGLMEWAVKAGRINGDVFLSDAKYLSQECDILYRRT